MTETATERQKRRAIINAVRAAIRAQAYMREATEALEAAWAKSNENER